MPNPPVSGPTSNWANRVNRAAIPVRPRIEPARMNSGIASSVNESAAPKTVCGRMESGHNWNAAIVSRLLRPSATAMGRFSARNRTSEPKSVNPTT